MLTDPDAFKALQMGRSGILAANCVPRLRPQHLSGRGSETDSHSATHKLVNA